jgi:hypothetical protein
MSQVLSHSRYGSQTLRSFEVHPNQGQKPGPSNKGEALVLQFSFYMGKNDEAKTSRLCKEIYTTKKYRKSILGHEINNLQCELGMALRHE